MTFNQENGFFLCRKEKKIHPKQQTNNSPQTNNQKKLLKPHPLKTPRNIKKEKEQEEILIKNLRKRKEKKEEQLGRNHTKSILFRGKNTLPNNMQERMTVFHLCDQAPGVQTWWKNFNLMIFCHYPPNPVGKIVNVLYKLPMCKEFKIRSCKPYSLKVQ